MKEKKYTIVFVLLFIIILVAGIYTIKKLKEKQEVSVIEEEYTPEEEISEEQNDTRDTIVTVYFPNKETGKLMPEAKTVDVREIVNNPYQKLFELLVQGPQSDKLQKIIPENTLILGSTIKNGCVTLNLSSEILNYDKEKENAKFNLIQSIVNTLTELTEVTKVKIIVEGQDHEEFNEEYERITEQT